LWTGNLSAALNHTRLLVDLTNRHGLSHWAAYGAGYRRIVALKSANADTSSRPPNAPIEEIDQSDLGFQPLSAIVELVEALIRLGRRDEALAAFDRRAGQLSEVSCFTPELLRLRGELELLQAAPSAANRSENLFRQALDLAHGQGALSWELRAAMSLARLLSHQGSSGEAIACLKSVYERFTEGFDTADLVAAKRLQDELSDG
jgi:tetratricopeptide (TPR) repeat protein